MHRSDEVFKVFSKLVWRLAILSLPLLKQIQGVWRDRLECYRPEAARVIRSLHKPFKVFIDSSGCNDPATFVAVFLPAYGFLIRLERANQTESINWVPVRCPK